MNRSRYESRPVDNTDRTIIAALAKNARMTFRDLAARIGLSSPSVTERIRKLEDSGAIAGYTIAIDPEAFGLGIAAYMRLSAIPGEVARVTQLLVDAPEIVEADRVTGSDAFVAKLHVANVQQLEALIDRFAPHASTDTAIVQSSPVARRLPKM